jgi:hemerythrin
MEIKMPLFTWYNKYSVNNEELDSHHKKLFNIFNRLYDTCIHTENKNCIEPILEELLSYADYHFKAEEKYMADTGYKDIVNHTQMHCYFIERVMEMQQVEDKNDYKIIKELIVFLGNWLRIHIIEEDKKYAV